MVEPGGTLFSYLLTTYIFSIVRAADFVGLNAGRLRDFYRIGKMLGSGK